MNEYEFKFGKPDPNTPPAKQNSGEHAHGILTEAAAIVIGDRNAVHGDKERSFDLIAELWTAYLKGRKTDRGAPIHAIDVAQMMVLLKIARSIQGQPTRDHYVDAAGYAAIAGELARRTVTDDEPSRLSKYQATYRQMAGALGASR